jgi:hypothetical protein
VNTTNNTNPNRPLDTHIHLRPAPSRRFAEVPVERQQEVAPLERHQ